MQAERVTRDVVAFIYKKCVCVCIYMYVCMYVCVCILIITAHFAREDA